MSDTLQTMMTQQPNPFIRAGDGPWMRRYLDWAQSYYERFPEPQRSEAAEFDRWLYSRRSLPALLSSLMLIGGVLLAMMAADVSFRLALILVVLMLIMCAIAFVRAWLGPDGIEHLTKKPMKGWRRDPMMGMLWVAGLGFLGSPFGYVIGRALRYPEQVSPVQVVMWAWESIRAGLPITLALLGVAMGVIVIVQGIRKQRLSHELERVQVQRERDTQAALATKAQLKVLQAQIQPHFVFNTLAALQHWTDTQDPRASGLLKTLTSFLRRSTDSMAQELVPLKGELALVTDYLSIMQHRLGPQKLRFEIEPGSDAQALEQSIPPAVLLSLVENAVEHGIGASLSGGLVRVSVHTTAVQLVIEVLNTGAELPATFTEGVGLSNCRARLTAHFGAAADLTLTRLDPPAGALARLSLPKLGANAVESR